MRNIHNDCVFPSFLIFTNIRPAGVMNVVHAPVQGLTRKGTELDEGIIPSLCEEDC